MYCNKCNSFAQWGIDNICEDFLEKYWDYEKNVNINPWGIDKNSMRKKIYIKCQEKDYHESYDIYCSSFIRGDRCPYCSNHNGKVHPLDSLGALYPQVLKLWSDKNRRSAYEYSPKSQQKVYWKCPQGLHEDYPRSICSSNSYNFRCPECESSKGEERISNYFISLDFIKIDQEDYKILDNISKNSYKYYIPQKKFDGLVGVGNGLLSYDFYLPNLQYNFLIEYDGEYHYKPIKINKYEPLKYAEERLKKQQEHDKRKDEYAKKHNINLLRIPYWDFDNIETILDESLRKIN